MQLNLTISKMSIIQTKDHNQEHTCKWDKLQSHQFGFQEIILQTHMLLDKVIMEQWQDNQLEKHHLELQMLLTITILHWIMLVLMRPLTLLTCQVSTAKFLDKMELQTQDQHPTDSKETQNMFLHMPKNKVKLKDGTMAGTSFHQWPTEKRSLQKLASHLQINITIEQMFHRHNTQMVHLMDFNQKIPPSDQTKFE